MTLGAKEIVKLEKESRAFEPDCEALLNLARTLEELESKTCEELFGEGFCGSDGATASHVG